jgi:antirestriction protein ArdC
MNNIYETVTERILHQLEKGVVPWRKSWFQDFPKA